MCEFRLARFDVQAGIVRIIWRYRIIAVWCFAYDRAISHSLSAGVPGVPILIQDGIPYHKKC
jgi:hypothetical protein